MRRLKEKAYQERRSFKDVVNETLRNGLDPSNSQNHESSNFIIKAHHCGFRSGIDQGKLNQLADQIDEEDFIAESSRDE